MLTAIFILEPRPINTNDRILSVLATHKGFLYKLRIADYQNHIDGTDTYYFQGNGQASVAETLVMIDIDCQKCLGLGSKEGAHEFAAHLKATYFPDIYFEPSTNGIGVHGYVVLHKLGLPTKTVNAQLRTFEKWLKQVARRIGADIEGVEIKGTCPVFEWQGGKLVRVKAGTNAKLPRGDVRATTHIGITDLAKFVPVEEEVPEVCRSSHGSSSASWCPKAITTDVLADMPRLRDVAEMLGLPREKCSGRVAVTVEDVAVFLLLVRFFTRNMNENGTLPWARFEALWTALYQAGDVERAFNPKRFAAIRNHLSSLVVDEKSYLIGRTRRTAWARLASGGHQMCPEGDLAPVQKSTHPGRPAGDESTWLGVPHAPLFLAAPRARQSTPADATTAAEKGRPLTSARPAHHEKVEMVSNLDRRILHLHGCYPKSQFWLCWLHCRFPLGWRCLIHPFPSFIESLRQSPQADCKVLDGGLDQAVYRKRSRCSLCGMLGRQAPRRRKSVKQDC